MPPTENESQENEQSQNPENPDTENADTGDQENADQGSDQQDGQGDTQDGPQQDADGPQDVTGQQLPADDGIYAQHASKAFRETSENYRKTRAECPACKTADGIRQNSKVCDSCGASFDESPNPA